jgi:predicted flap endonuclease-1-like 5' DNA nuclease
MKVNSYPLETLPGLETTYEQHLATLGIHTTVDLCRQGQSDQQQQALAQTLRVPQRYITKWVVLAELSRVPGVGCQFCGVLLHSGISSVRQLATSSPQTLYHQVRRLNVTAMGRVDQCPTPDQIQRWIQDARLLLRRSASA